MVMRKPLVADPRRTALLCIDLQEEHRQDERYLVDGFETILANTARIQEAARRAGVPVLHFAYVVDPSGEPMRRFHPVTADGKSSFSNLGDPRTEICPEVAPIEGESLFIKTDASAFSHADLEPLLRDHGLEFLILAGVWTEACIAASVKDGVDRGFRVILVKDACGSGTAAMHATAVINLANRLYGGAVVVAEQAVEVLGGSDVTAWQVEGSTPLRFGFDDVAEVYAGL